MPATDLPVDPLSWTCALPTTPRWSEPTVKSAQPSLSYTSRPHLYWLADGQTGLHQSPRGAGGTQRGPHPRLEMSCFRPAKPPDWSQQGDRIRSAGRYSLDSHVFPSLSLIHIYDKWLCMMYPRLKLLQKLLAEDGAIFISIDSTELSSLHLLCNEIFGNVNFVDYISWFKKASPSNDAKYFSNDIEYILVFAKNKAIWRPSRLPLTEKQLRNYQNPDNDPRGCWNSATYTCNKSKEERPSLYYPILNPNTGQEVWPKETAVWAYSKEQYEEHIKNNLLYWGVDGKAKYPDVYKRQSMDCGSSIVMSGSTERSSCVHAAHFPQSCIS